MVKKKRNPVTNRKDIRQWKQNSCLVVDRKKKTTKIKKIVERKGKPKPKVNIWLWRSKTWIVEEICVIMVIRIVPVLMKWRNEETLSQNQIKMSYSEDNISLTKIKSNGEITTKKQR